MVSQILENTEEKMRKAVEGLKKDLLTIRTGRATPALIENVKVAYAGVLTPLVQLAAISAPEPRLLIIQPWDKSSLREIEKAILTSDLGLNPANDGNIIRLNIPPLSEERRQELMKVVRRRAEERKIVIRNLRREAIETLRELEKNKDMSQDEHKHALNQLQKLTDSYIASVEQVEQDKEAELTRV